MLTTAQSECRKGARTADAAESTGLQTRSGKPQAQPESRLARLQSAHGNQHLQRLLGRGVLQAKLTVNQPGDVYEQEADRMADAVMRMSVSGAPDSPIQPGRASTGVQRCSCGGSDGETGQCQECKEKDMGLHRVESSSSQIDTAPPIVTDVLRSPGQPLDASTRAFMELCMGHDFSQVRVHTGARAADSAKAVNALAYTVGTNVVFGEGQYAPASPSGQRLLAHELTHTLQQTSASALRVARATSSGNCETFNYPGRKAGTSTVPGKTSLDDQCVTGITGTTFERFAESSDSLTPIHLGLIASLQSTLAATDTMEVHGYASCDGGAQYNLGLSSDRAEAVNKALTTTGKSPFTGTVTTLAHGETNEFGSTLDANRRAIVVVHHVTPKACPQCPEEPRTEGCPPCQPRLEPPVFFCNKEITGSLIHRQGHAFFRVGGAAPGNPTFELEHDDRGDHCPCGFQGIPQRDFKEDVDATDAKCVAAPEISASCLAKNWNTYPVGKYCALGPNSNTYARFLAKKCGGKSLRPPGGVQGFDDSPPTAGTANDTSTVFTLRCNEISCDDKSCLPPAPPTEREKQVECVKDQGLCGIPGGIPTDENIHQWNEL
jgi:outer membrane protein OmpA-like peptidoglycan-associated protein